MRGGSFAEQSLGNSVLRSGGPPPDLFIPKEILSAWETSDPYAHRAKSSSTSAQKLGLAYQRKITKWIQEGDCSSWTVRPGVWYCYHDPLRRRFCQPDILLIDESSKCMVVVEVKLRWSCAAWWQLSKLYIPVLRRVFGPEWTLIPLCVTKSYDPSIAVLDEVKICDDLFDTSPSSFNVLVVR